MSGVRTDMVSVTVHGPFGAIDLVVPSAAAVSDVAREYAAQAAPQRSAPTAPLGVLTTTGRWLSPDLTVLGAGILSGDVLIASRGPAPSGPVPGLAHATPPTARDGLAWLAAAAACAVVVLAGVLAASSSEDVATAAIVVLGVTAVLALLPSGTRSTQRAVVAPVAAGAAAFAVVHEPGAVHLPVTVGVAALVASVAAATARALGAGRRQPLDVILVMGLAWFGLAALVTLTGAPPQVFWSLLLAASLLACRVVPGLAVDVPDPMLIDLDRLAVTAWSARERRPGKRGRVLVSPDLVRGLLADGAATVNAAGVAIGVTAVLATPGLIDTATLGVDRLGAVFLVLLTAGGMVLAARNLRHVVARTALRAAGVLVAVAMVLERLGGLGPIATAWLLVALVLVALLVVVAAVATGRGWRSVRWARRAELAESLCLAFAMGAVVVSSGAFRMVWELQS